MDSKRVRIEVQSVFDREGGFYKPVLVLSQQTKPIEHARFAAGKLFAGLRPQGHERR